MTKFLALLAVISLNFNALADEGMWLYSHLPTEKIEKTYGFKVTPEWAEHVMKSSLRLGVGGSGSFISPDGLILTNHHVAANSLAKLSVPGGKNYYLESFLAANPSEELKTPDLEINQLQKIDDVTAQVNAAVTPDMDSAKANAARLAVIAKLEIADPGVKKQKKQVVALYQGARYHLYTYKVFDDIRVVFSPGFDIAFFGGDADNFEFPRWCLDMTILRAYEDGKPAKVDHYLKWSAKGAKDGELVFVSGHPGRTNRLLTMASTVFQRDVRLPYARKHFQRLEIALQQYSLNGAEENRRADDMLHSVQNSRKAYEGKIQALQEPGFMSRKGRDEALLLNKVLKNDKLKPLAEAWKKIADAQVDAKKVFLHYNLLETGHAFNSKLFKIARTLVRLAAEDGKPNEKRLKEFQAAGRSTLERDLYSTAPTYPDLEEALMADSLTFLVGEFGEKEPELVDSIMRGKSPRDRATELVYGTALIEVGVRERIAGRGLTEKASEKMKRIQEAAKFDPMIRLAILVDPIARKYRKLFEDRVEEVERQGYGQIAQATSALLVSEANGATFETSVYPDATFTLRLSYGQVKGYTEGIKQIPAITDFAGAFKHETDYGSQKPFKLPSVWHDRKDKADMTTPFDFVSTNDIIGGNSGSPVVNKDGELVGLIFDGNIQSLAGDYYYDGTVNRATSVHSAGIREALEKIYDAQSLIAKPPVVAPLPVKGPAPKPTVVSQD